LCFLGCGEDADDMEDMPTDEEPQSRIAFVSNRDGYQRIYVMKADGRNQRPLTDPQYGEDTHPVWSPDGSTLAFISTSDGEPDIHLVDANGANRRNLTNSRDRAEAALSWSRDGARIAYAALVAQEDVHALFVVEVDGVYPRVLLDWLSNPRRIAWAPDEGPVVYQAGPSFDSFGQHVVWTRSVDGETSERFGPPAGNTGDPTWSPNGLAVAMVGPSVGLTITDDRGENARFIETNPGGTPRWPSWSPDGREIAYADANGGYPFVGHIRPGWSDIWVVNLYDGSHRQLTNTRDYDGMPAWSP